MVFTFLENDLNLWEEIFKIQSKNMKLTWNIRLFIFYDL